MRSTLFCLLGLVVACQPDSGLKVYNTAPEVTLTSPADGQVFHQAEVVTFSAFVTDGQSGNDQLSWSWASSLQGPLVGEQTVNDAGAVFVPEGLEGGAHTV